MDATDHENIPNPSRYSGISSWIHVGFDYLGHDSKIMSSPIQFLKNESERKHTGGKSKTVESKSSSDSNRKQCCSSLDEKYFSRHPVANFSMDSCNSTNSSPAVTPQASPSLRRKMDSGLAVSSSQPIPTYNPLLWIKGYFNSESDEFPTSPSKISSKLKRAEKRSVHKEPRKFIITNFDINALSPTSW